jgi:hypothetical protein
MLPALFLSALLFQVPTIGNPSTVATHPPASFKLTVYVFTTTDCPISNRYAPEVQRLAAKFKGHASFVLVYPVPTDTDAVIREHHNKFGYSLPSVRDIDQRLVRRTGATMMPEVAVVQGNAVLYRGRIDDRYIDLGKDRPAPTQRDLESALDAAIAGKPIAVKQTQAVGCILSELIK